jgi:hypothetical protein
MSSTNSEDPTYFSPKQTMELQAVLNNNKGTVGSKTTAICNILKDYDISKNAAIDWAQLTMKTIYASEILGLAHQDSGLHFFASNMTEERLRSFDITALCQKFEGQAPALWMMLDSVFTADSKHQYKRDWARNKRKGEGHGKCTQATNHHDGDIEMDDISVSATDIGCVDKDDEGEDEPEDASERYEDRCKKNIMIVSHRMIHGIRL